MWKRLAFLTLAAIVVVSQFAGSEAQSKSANVTSLLNFKPPKDWHLKFPYYISGFDKEGHPIFLVEYGKWDIMPFMTGGEEKARMMSNYIEQTVQSYIQLGTAFEDSDGAIFMGDFEGLDYAQMTHLPTVLMLLRMARYNPQLDAAMSRGIGLNMNYATEVLFGIISPVVGSSLAKSELYGTNKERWMAKLGTIIPRSQLPPWYGGSKNWKPLQVLGRGEPMDIEFVRRAQAQFLQGKGQ